MLEDIGILDIAWFIVKIILAIGLIFLMISIVGLIFEGIVEYLNSEPKEKEKEKEKLKEKEKEIRLKEKLLTEDEKNAIADHRKETKELWGQLITCVALYKKDDHFQFNNNIELLSYDGEILIIEEKGDYIWEKWDTIETCIYKIFGKETQVKITKLP